MPEPIFRYVGQGKSPEAIRIDVRGGLLRIMVRSPPTAPPGADPFEFDATAPLQEGPSAEIALPLTELPKLLEMLLQVPLTGDLKQAVPFTLWFTSQVELNRFVGKLRDLDPSIETVQLSRR